MKKIVRLAILLIALCTGFIAKAQTYTDENGINYTLKTQNNKYIATCNGPTDKTNFSTANLIIEESIQYEGQEYTVNAIAENAFKGCTGITGSLNLPQTITTIGGNAFYGCSGLTGTLDLSNITSVSQYSFCDCYGFDELKLGEGLIMIGVGTFQGCYGFKGTLDLSHVKVIVQYCFDGCSGFDRLILGDGLGREPGKETRIGVGAFRNCSGFKGDLTIPDGVTSINDFAFDGCTGFDGILTLGEGLTKIARGAFRNCSNLKGPKEGAFDLKNVTEIQGESQGGAFQNCSSLTGTLDLSKVTKLGPFAFRNCSGFTGDLVIPNSVTSIGLAAFAGCSGFDGKLDLSDLNTSIKGFPHYVFQDCKNLKGDLILPNHLTYLEFSVFNGCESLDGKLQLSENLEEIGPYSFRNCKNLTGPVVFPAAFKNFGDPNYYEALGAFSGCEKLTSVQFLCDKVNLIPEDVFSGCSGLQGEIEIPTLTVNTVIGDNAFYGCENVKRIVLPENTTGIGVSSFENCSSLQSLELPTSVATLGKRAYAGCSSLAMDFIIPETLAIGEECFSGSGLTGVVIPDYSDLSVANNAFSNLSDCLWFISLSDDPTTNTYGRDEDVPMYVHSHFVDAYTEKGHSNVEPLLKLDNIVVLINEKAQVKPRYQPESLSKETHDKIMKLDHPHQGTSIEWSHFTNPEPETPVDPEYIGLLSTDDDDVIEFDRDNLIITAKKEGSATITADDQYNKAAGTVFVVSLTGVDDIAIKGQVVLINNIVFAIDPTAATTVTVYNLVGQPVTRQFYAAGEKPADISGLVPGTYIINVASGAYNSSAKLGI